MLRSIILAALPLLASAAPAPEPDFLSLLMKRADAPSTMSQCNVGAIKMDRKFLASMHQLMQIANHLRSCRTSITIIRTRPRPHRNWTRNTELYLRQQHRPSYSKSNRCRSNTLQRDLHGRPFHLTTRRHAINRAEVPSSRRKCGLVTRESLPLRTSLLHQHNDTVLQS
jgi:hypothetical protein